MIWSVVQVFGKQTLIGLTVFVLAFYLTPTDFGVVGMALAWIVFIQTFAEIGFGAAIIQRQDLVSPERYFSTLFFVNLALGVALTVVGFAFSWLCALFFGTPAVQPVMAALSVTFLINALTITQVTLAQKELRFRDLARRDIIAALTSGVVGILAAREGWGAWSLVAQSLSQSAVAALLLWKMTPWVPRLSEYSQEHLRELWPYSSQIFAFNIFKYFAQNTDKLIIGAIMGAGPLGIYTFATRLVFTPVNTLLGAVGVYLFPKYSLMQNDLQAVRTSYLLLMKGVNVVVAPFLALCAVLSGPFVETIWGQKWLPAVSVIQVLCVLALIQTQIVAIGQLLKALNRPTWLLRWSVFITIAIALLVTFGTIYGLEGVSAGLVAAYMIGLPVVTWMLLTLLRLKLVQLVSTIAWPLVCGTLVGGLVYITLPIRLLSPAADLVLKATAALVLYAAVIVVAERRTLLVLARSFRVQRGVIS